MPSSTSSPASDTSHLDGLIADAGGADIGQAAVTPVMIDRDEFHKIFTGGFSLAHGVTKLQSLNVPEGDEGARQCAYALHETILEIPALHFILYPQSKMAQRVIAIGMFTVPMAIATSRELRERRGQGGQQPKASFSQAKEATRPTTPPAEGDPTPEQLEALRAMHRVHKE